MRIAQVAPLTEAVPPKLYGGTERADDILDQLRGSEGEAAYLYFSVFDHLIRAPMPLAAVETAAA